MYKAYKFRLYPDDVQKTLINKTFGCMRLVYNHYLYDIKESGYKNSYACINDYVNNLKYQYPFLQEVDSISIRKVIFNLDDNLKRTYNLGFGYPKYKNKFDKYSYTTSCIYGKYKGREYANISVDLKNKKIKLPKLGIVKIRGYRNLKYLPDKIINATISREKNGKYYVSVIVCLPQLEYVEPKSIVGIDVGIKKLITLSDSVTYDNNKYIDKYEKRIIKVQRELSKKKKGSNNYFKCLKKLNILYIKLYNARKYYLHKITKEITNNYDIICVENLNTKKMIMQKQLSKKLTDASFGELLRQLKYKALEKGKYFYEVDTYYPSSQICSVCNHRDKKYKDLKERTYQCTNCHSILDRDLNASINIFYEGLKLFMKEKYNLVPGN